MKGLRQPTARFAYCRKGLIQAYCSTLRRNGGQMGKSVNCDTWKELQCLSFDTQRHICI